MGKLPVPDLMLPSLFELSPEAVKGMGVKLLLLDLDNTMSPYGEDTPGEPLRKWIRAMKDAGVVPFILSNNRGPRPGVFARELGIEYANRAKKPSAKVLVRVLAEKGVLPGEAALAGDQIYTDVLCAKRAGIAAIAVRPISLKNPLLAVRYVFECPFRLLGRGNTLGKLKNTTERG